MMIKKMNSGGLIAELGNGTLFTGVVSSEGIPVGVCFTNNEDKALDENSIVLQITSDKAVVSYIDLMMRYLSELMKTLDNDSDEVIHIIEQIEEFRDSVKHLMPEKAE